MVPIHIRYGFIPKYTRSLNMLCFFFRGTEMIKLSVIQFSYKSYIF